MIDNIRQIAARVFSVSQDDISGASKPGDFPAWDSMGQLNLFLAIEGELKVKFKPDEIMSALSIAEIADKVSGRLS